MRTLLSLYNPILSKYLVYMLQQVNYDPRKFLKWLADLFKKNKSINNVMHRQTLKYTKKVKILILLDLIFVTTFIMLFVYFGLQSISSLPGALALFVILLFVSPFLSVLFLILVSVPSYFLFAQQRLFPEVKASEALFKNHNGKRIAVAGSYGKTSIKEILNTVLNEKLKVATTPGNMNTPVAHARFAKMLSGDEDVLVIEYGEEHPGDVRRFAKITHPDIAFITGIAPNHLEYYKTIDALADDIFSLRDVISKDCLFIAADGEITKDYIIPGDITFDQSEVAGWSISNIRVQIDKTSFSMQRGGKKIDLHTGLLGRHQVPVVAIVAVLALDLGLSIDQVKSGVSKTKSFEHRMSPYQLAGSWIIDDTYNGNIQGMLAGLTLLGDLNTVGRKIYVTPGLVDQGNQTQSVHETMAKKIYDINPDIVVLMANSATKIINESLTSLKYKGKVQIVEDPLLFYQSLDKYVAAGDVVLMQNDWTDNYN